MNVPVLLFKENIYEYMDIVLCTDNGRKCKIKYLLITVIRSECHVQM